MSIDVFLFEPEGLADAAGCCGAAGDVEEAGAVEGFCCDESEQAVVASRRAPVAAVPTTARRRGKVMRAVPGQSGIGSA
ncbi:hypothetical protein [Streptomyces lancefieldiae]|uniref:Uncharacterized protein n=1 Tax=Streptomyces lancefieldiae TaxID=3075520 RepID=A0ABU3ATF0_9ACTN|nr:hypothetical protein [Streptomyces sp. DSM 40712]MDT0612106.1 hypothetical protein [Streptomyces sp. DSM 40712]